MATKHPALSQPPSANDLALLHAAQKRAIINSAAAPRNFEGRGIVISVFDRGIATAWVLLSELERLHIALPIQAFHLASELSTEHAALLSSLELDLELRVLPDRVNGFAIKPFAIWRSTFKEVLWLDADNFPIRDPTFLFDDAEFRQKGSLFWRDVVGTDRAPYWHPTSPVWSVFNVPANDAEEFETGQLLVDKEKRWTELGLTLHFAEQSNVYYYYVHGDKDTFRLAWQNIANARKKSPPSDFYLSQPDIVPYGFMPYGPFHMGRPNAAHKWGGGTVMVQRDRTGAPLFNHRNLEKFTLDGENPFNADIQNEAIYHLHIDALRRRLKS